MVFLVFPLLCLEGKAGKRICPSLMHIPSINWHERQSLPHFKFIGFANRQD
jgi:hypothetical protein